MVDKGADRSGMLVRVSRVLEHAEDLIYLAVGAVLVAAAAVLLVSVVREFLPLNGEHLRGAIVGMLESLLLVLMLVEILHTVGISLREHELITEPFLIVGLIAAIRRILVITAEQQPTNTPPDLFRMILLELGLLTLLILALVVAIWIIRRYGSVGAEKPAVQGEQVQPGPEPGTYLVRLPGGEQALLVPREQEQQRVAFTAGNRSPQSD